MKILVLLANPGAEKLRIREEYYNIRRELSAGSAREKFSIEVETATRRTDIQGIMSSAGADVVLFSGHGNDRGQIILEGANAEPELVPVTAFLELAELSSDNVQCVILNCCHSAKSIVSTAGIPYVIAMNNAIGDLTAVAFSKGFFAGLFNGKEIEKSFRLGINAIRIQNLPQEQIPALIRNDGRDYVSGNRF